MIEEHDGTVKLLNPFKRSYEWLRSNGEIDLKTAKGTPFTARSEIAKKGIHSGEEVIKQKTRWGRWCKEK